MTVTIFYSWQSDRPNNVNRGFIEDALNKAIKQIGKEAQVQSSLRLDKDTQGIPGTPSIVETIFNKISECAIFVPDLTHVGEDNRKKMLPNPNVLIEYGWALKEVTNKRIVSIVNTAYGKYSPESLPFNIRHLRAPISYKLSDTSSLDDKKREKVKLVDVLVRHLSLILKSADLDLTKRLNNGFKEHQPIDIPSTFFKRGDYIGQINRKYFNLPINEKIFLRMIPTKPIDEIKSTKVALKLLDDGKLISMGEKGGGYSERNKYGAFICQIVKDQVTHFTQLFLNREIWGIDAESIDKNVHMKLAEVNHGYFPCSSFESCFITSMKNYINFYKNVLNIPAPVRFIAGATDVTGFRMTVPYGLLFVSGEFDGNVVDSNIVFEGVIDSYDKKVEKILRPFFDKVWEECGLERPDKESL